MKRVAYLVAMLSLAPLVLSVLVSLTPAEYLDVPRGELSTRWYVEIWQTPIWREAFEHTLVVGLVTMLLSLGTGLAAAVALSRGRLPKPRLVEAGLLLPLLLPPVALAAGMLALVRLTPLWGTLAALVIAHTVVSTPVAYLVLRAGLDRVDPALEAAARGLGASPWRAFQHVTLPLMAPAVLAAGLFCLAISLNEITLTLFLATRDSETLPRLIWPHLRFALTPAAAAASGALLATTLPAVLVAGYVLRPRHVA